MPVQVSYPGVYIQEISSGSRTITGVSTSVALFVGMADQGPMDVPVRTLSLTEFERTFGASNSSGELHDQVSQFFLNGGATAWIIRIANGAIGSALTLQNQNKANALTLTARSKGVLGNNLRAIVDYNTSTPEMTFNLTLQLWGVDTGGTPIVVTSETFKGLSMDPSHGKYVVDVLEQNSALVTAEDVAGSISSIDGYTLWGQMETSGSPDANLAAAILAAGTTGSFQVSVDDGPYVNVSISSTNTTSIASAISTATGKTIAVSQLYNDGGGTYRAYKVSVTGGRRIRFAPVLGSDDIAVAMAMTAELGALEVDGYAIRRPAPSGYFSKLSFETEGAFQSTFGALMLTPLGTVSPLFTDTPNGANGVSPSWLDTGGTMAAPGSAEPTLRAIQQNIDALVAALNADATIGASWTAARHGHRLVTIPNFNGDVGDDAVTLTGDATYFDPYFTVDPNVTRYQIGTLTAYDYQSGGVSGSDGSTPLPVDYAAAYVTADREIDLFNILVLPQAGTQGDGDRASLWGPASVFAKGRRAVLLVDPPAGWSDYTDVSDGIADLRVGVATDHAAIYWPRIKVSTGTTVKSIDPSGAMAGIMARTDAARGVWKAPAGLEANLYGVRGVEHPMSDGENGVINPLAVNAIRAFPNGIVAWGARTMVGFDNSGNDDYKYFPVRRLALYIEESLYRGLKWAVFEPNDEPLWRQLRQSAGAFMNNLFRLGAFAGAKASDAYFVKVDRDTTTQNDINLGIVNVMVGFAPLKPAEFVVITLQQKAGEVQT